MARDESLTVDGIMFAWACKVPNRPFGLLKVAFEIRSYHHPIGVQRASGRLALRVKP